MNTRQTRIQKKLRQEAEAYKARYDFWIKFDFAFRLASFQIIEESEKDREEKSLEYKVLFEVTH